MDGNDGKGRHSTGPPIDRRYGLPVLALRREVLVLTDLELSFWSGCPGWMGSGWEVVESLFRVVGRGLMFRYLNIEASFFDISQCGVIPNAIPSFMYISHFGIDTSRGVARTTIRRHSIF